MRRKRVSEKGVVIMDALLPPLAAESNDFPVMSEESFRKFEARSPGPKKSEGPDLE